MSATTHPAGLDPDRIVATYRLDTAEDPARAAEIIAGEQSSGTFVALARETAGLKEKAGARVERLEVVGESPGPGLPGAKAGPVLRRCELTLSWPLANIGPSLPNLVATVAGNLFELNCVAGLRLVDLALPPAFAARYPGPRHGIAGTRALAGVSDGPLIGTIVKPSVGLSPQETAHEVAQLVEGGIDFVKDDELQADGANCPFEERVRAVMRVVNAAADRTGKKAMIAFNVTGDLDEMRHRHDVVVAQGGTCVMASLHSVGFVGMIELARHSVLPIHAHRNGWGYLSRHPALGFDYAPWQRLWRLAGADHLHVNGLANKFCEDDASVVASARAVLAPLFPGAPMAAMPVFSSGQTVRQAAPTFAAVGTTDLIYAAGGGIFGHPGGVRAGVVALRKAWQAAVEGVPLDDLAAHDAEVAAALGIGRMTAAPALPDGLLLAFYGDDFTGSTDTMEVMTFAGLDTVLFLDDPTPERLARFPTARAVGIAGVSRSKDPAWMDAHLPGRFAALARLGAPVLQYKICSTFDSAPHVGSVGRAIDLGVGFARAAFTPMVVGAPRLRRFQSFGNLFATLDDVGYRLDRHPTMAHHPVTPMAEADLCLHLARQTDRRIALVHLVQLKQRRAADRLAALAGPDVPVVLIDVLDDETLEEAGRLVWENRGAGLFTASSSGLQYALVAHWRAAGVLPPEAPPRAAPAVERIAVVSGSCSPATHAQIDWAAGHGFEAIRLDAPAAVGGDGAAEAHRCVDLALAALDRGRDPIVYSARGPADPSLAAVAETARRAGLDAAAANARIGQALAATMAGILARTGLSRVAVAGGDTSGEVAGGLGLMALTALAPLAPGSPLCAAWPADPSRPPIEIALKGGQVGTPSFFGAVKAGAPLP